MKPLVKGGAGSAPRSLRSSASRWRRVILVASVTASSVTPAITRADLSCAPKGFARGGAGRGPSCGAPADFRAKRRSADTWRPPTTRPNYQPARPRRVAGDALRVEEGTRRTGSATLSAVRHVRGNGMFVVGGLIVGNPGDTRESIETNLAFTSTVRSPGTGSRRRNARCFQAPSTTGRPEQALELQLEADHGQNAPWLLCGDCAEPRVPVVATCRSCSGIGASRRRRSTPGSRSRTCECSTAAWD